MESSYVRHSQMQQFGGELGEKSRRYLSVIVALSTFRMVQIRFLVMRSDISILAQEISIIISSILPPPLRRCKPVAQGLQRL